MRFHSIIFLFLNFDLLFFLLFLSFQIRWNDFIVPTICLLSRLPLSQFLLQRFLFILLVIRKLILVVLSVPLNHQLLLCKSLLLQLILFLVLLSVQFIIIYVIYSL